MAENELLCQKIDALVKLLYGVKSEKIDPAQLPLLAPAPTAPLSGGTPTFLLTAQLIVSKYADHLPLYRQP